MGTRTSGPNFIIISHFSHIKKNVFPKIMHAKNQKAKSEMFFEGSSITSLNKILMSHSLLFIMFSLI